MRVKIENLLLRLLVRFPFTSIIYSRLPISLKRTYTIFRPTFSHTNISKRVTMSSIVTEAGKLREKYGYDLLPDFRENVKNGFNSYILKTCSNTIEHGDLHFGEKIIISTEINDIDTSSGRFSLLFNFFHNRQIVSTIRQQIYYVDTGIGNAVKEEFFNRLKQFNRDNYCYFSLYEFKKQFLRYKYRSDYIFEYGFRWNLRSTTEEKNTKNDSFIDFLHDGLESLLIENNDENRELLASGKIKLDKLDICYIQDFQFHEKTVIRYFKEKNNNIVAIFLPGEPLHKGAAFAKFNLPFYIE